MNVQIIFGFVLAMVLVVNTEANCCKRKGYLCCGNGKCDMNCCNCDGGCNAHCERSNLTLCNALQWIECSAELVYCAFACITRHSQACHQCMGETFNACKNCISSDVDKQRAFDDTKNMLDSCVKEILPYNVHLEHLFKIAEEKYNKGRH